MSLLRAQQLFRRLALSPVCSNQLQPTLSLTTSKTAGLISPKRFFIPTLSTRQIQPPPATNLEDSVEVRPRKIARRISITNSTRQRWTAEEDQLIKRSLHRGLTSMDIYDHFPDRSMTAIESRMSFFRSKEKGNTTTLPNTHKPSKMKRWTPEQDQWLREQVEELGQGDDIPWLEIGTQEVDGMRLGRTPTSCKRRWDIINPFNDRKSGRWDPEELKKLADAVAEQLEQLEDVKSQEAKGRLIDWSIVARKVGTRSDVQCRSHMHKSMQAEIKGRWKEDEVERMKVALQEHGQDWKKIAKVVKTRTPFQVKQKYYMSNARLPRLLNAELRPGSEEPKPAKSTTTNQDTTGA